MSFKENLRYALDSKGMQIKELSRKSGISENTLKSYLKENGAEPTLSKAVTIANALDVSLEQMAGCDKTLKKQTPEILEINSLIKTLNPKEQKVILSVIKSMKAYL